MVNNFNKEFKVTMSLHQKYYMLRLAEGLVRRGNLDIIYSPYPKRMILSSYAIPNKKLKSFRFIGALRYIFTKFGKKDLDEKAVFLFDKIVSLSLKKPLANSIFHGLNISCEFSLKQAKKLGFITLVERACPHEDFQYELLKEEYHRLLGARLKWTSEKTMGRMRREYDLADYIIVPSQYSLKSFLERGFSPSKVLVVPLISEKMTAPSSLPKDKFTALCVGGNFYRKGLFYLLKAWERLGLRDSELIIKGYLPKEFDDLRKIKNVTIIDWRLSDKEVAALYQRASIFVLPSIDDGFGMVVAEAMAAALPVIITENVGIADGIENGKEGFVVPIRSIDALQEKIRFFYDHPESIAELGRAALVKSKQYTTEAYTRRMVDTYRSMLGAA